VAEVAITFTAIHLRGYYYRPWTCARFPSATGLNSLDVERKKNETCASGDIGSRFISIFFSAYREDAVYKRRTGIIEVQRKKKKEKNDSPSL
jgi:hypothetical protein